MSTVTQAAPHAAPEAAGGQAGARRYTVDIDIGGTLTDGLFSDGTTVTPVKVDTTPHDFTVCFFECLKEGGRRLGFGDLRPFLAEVAVIRWSATIATNIIAEGKGPRIGLLVSAGTGEELYGEGRSAAVGRLVAPANIVALPADASDKDTLTAIRALLERGVRRIAVSVAGAFEDDTAEQAVRRLVDESFPDHYLGAVPLVLGSEICHHPDDQTRTHMALVNAYVHTPLAVALFKAEDELLGHHGYRRPVYIAHVNGGVARVSKTKAVDTAESSPYFGLNACAWFARLYGEDRVLALDVGGTTTKLGVIADGRPMTMEHGDLLGVPLKTPWTLLRSEAVGGGSIARAQDGAPVLGPESQGAFPGPACYDLGGREPTLTDAFLVAGLLNPERFLGGRRALRRDLAEAALARAVGEPLGLSSRRPPSASSTPPSSTWPGWRSRRSRPRPRPGGLQALRVRRQRRELRRSPGRAARDGPRVRVRPRPGPQRLRLLRLGDHPRPRGVAVPGPRGPGTAEAVAAIAARGAAQVTRDLEGERLPVADARFERTLSVNRGGTTEEHALPAEPEAAREAVAALAAQGGVVDRVAVRGSSPVPRYEPTPEPEEPHAAAPAGTRELAGGTGDVYVWEDLRPGATADGPAVLESATNSCLVPAGWSVRIDGFGNALLQRSGRE
jgi:acetophenone carboxylase